MASGSNFDAFRAMRRYIERKCEKGHVSVFDQYFSEDLIYPSDIFRTRYRMQKQLFERIMNKLIATDNFFQQRPDAAGLQGMFVIEKFTAAMRVLAYGSTTDFHDEYLRMSAQLIHKSIIKFVEGVISNLRKPTKPTEEDIASLLEVGERGFPYMLGSTDCMHWEWENCPSSWASPYVRRSGKPTIILEEIASQDLWIWHAFFGTPCSRNDINVLDQSPLFDDILADRAPNVNYVVNGHEKNMGYLTYIMYPQWKAFIKSISAPQLGKHKLFAQHQEVA